LIVTKLVIGVGWNMMQVKRRVTMRVFNNKFCMVARGRGLFRRRIFHNRVSHDEIRKGSIRTIV